MRLVLTGSRPEKGSSSRRTRGSRARARPRATRLLSPPEIWWGWRSRPSPSRRRPHHQQPTLQTPDRSRLHLERGAFERAERSFREGLALAVERLRKSKAKSRVAILLTDGQVHDIEAAPDMPAPLHALLIDDLSRPLVATSGNLSDEPIVTDDVVAARELGAIADLVVAGTEDAIAMVFGVVMRDLSIALAIAMTAFGKQVTMAASGLPAAVVVDAATDQSTNEPVRRHRRKATGDKGVLAILAPARHDVVAVADSIQHPLDVGRIVLQVRVEQAGEEALDEDQRQGDPDRNVNSDIYVISTTAGSEPRRLTTWEGPDSSPVFSPDGKRVLARSSDGTA